MQNKYFLFDVGYVDKRHDPEPGGGNIEETREGQGGLVVAGGDAAHLLGVIGHPLDAVTVPVALPAYFLWSTAAVARWNDRQDPMRQQILAEAMTVTQSASMVLELGTASFVRDLWLCNPRPALP